MWIFLNDAFFSIVEPRRQAPRCNDLLVRARTAGDIERHFPHYEIQEDAGTDYAFRALVSRNHVANVIANQIGRIDYGNFKDSVPKSKPGYLQALHAIWDVMSRLQDRQRPPMDRYYDPEQGPEPRWLSYGPGRPVGRGAMMDDDLGGMDFEEGLRDPDSSDADWLAGRGFRR